MKPKETLSESFGETYGYVKAYVEHKLEFYKLDLAERISRALSLAVTIAVFLAILLLLVSFLSIAAALHLGERFESYPKGFLIVSGAYAVLTLLLFLLRRPLITNPILSRIIQVFFQKH